MAEIIDNDGEATRLPRPGDPYSAFGLPADDPPTVSFLLGDSGSVSLPYQRLGYSEFNPAGIGHAPDDVILLHFDASMAVAGSRFDASKMSGPRIVVTIKGRELLPLWDQLAERRARWVRELPKGQNATDRAAAVVSGIKVERIGQRPE